MICTQWPPEYTGMHSKMYPDRLIHMDTYLTLVRSATYCVASPGSEKQPDAHRRISGVRSRHRWPRSHVRSYCAVFEKNARLVKAAMDTDPKCTADIRFPPAIRISFDTDHGHIAVQMSHVVSRAIDCTCIPVTCRLVSERLRLQRGTQSCTPPTSY